MLGFILSLVTAAASVASVLTVRQIKRDHDRTLAALRPFVESLAAANKLLFEGVAQKTN